VTALAYKNNTYAIACYRDREECFVTYIEQIGEKQIGRIEYPYVYPVIKWDADENVAAEELTMLGCSKTTVTITTPPFINGQLRVRSGGRTLQAH
jgi:hypothetical protein